MSMNEKQVLNDAKGLIEKDPAAYIKEISKSIDIRSHSSRHIRAAELHKLVKAMVETREITGFSDDILFKADRAYFKLDGVWLDCTNDSYYLRSIGARNSIGRKVAKLLSAKQNSPKVLIDLGAFQGEVGFWLAKNYPDAKTHIIEASSGTFSALEGAAKIQEFDTKNLFTHNIAIGATDGTIEFSIGQGTKNSILNYDKNAKTESVTMKSFPTFMAENDIQFIDFCKIDIEGAEPMLAPAFKQSAKQFGLLLIEFSIFGDRDGYVELAEILIDSGMSCSFAEKVQIKRGEVKNFLKEVLDDKGKNAIDLVFDRP